MKIEIVEATQDHVRALMARLRDIHKADAASVGIPASVLLWRCWKASIVRKAALADGVVGAIWGAAGTISGGEGEVWLFTSPEFDTAPVAALRIARRELAALVATFGRLRGFVGNDPRSARFAEAAGLRVSDKRNYIGFREWRNAPVEQPFIVFGLPRSGTAWLAEFLTYGDWICGHEQAIYMRSVADIAAYFSRGRIGVVETAAAPAWRMLRSLYPDLRMAVIRRPIDEVMESFRKVQHIGIARFDYGLLAKLLAYESRLLDEIAAQPGTVAINYCDLGDETKAKAIFEHCLPYEFDAAWWQECLERNVQADIEGVYRYYCDHRDEIERFKSLMWSEMRKMVKSGQISKGARDAIG
jgi:hypothetical protein